MFSNDFTKLETKKRIDILQTLVSVLVVYCILFPADKLNVKEIIIVITLLCYLLDNRDNLRISKFIFGYGIVFPIILVLYSIIRGTSLDSTLSYGYVWIYLLLLPAITKYKIDIKKPFFFATYIVALIIDFIMIADVLGVFTIYSNPLSTFFMNMDELQGLGKGVLATFGYSIYYKSCPLILVTYGYMIYKKKYMLCLPLFLSMLACGTRANFLMAVFITVAVPILCIDKKSKKMLFVLIIFGVGFYLLPEIYDKLVALNALKYDRSESVKLSDMQTIFGLLSNNVFNSLFGFGVGSSFYSVRGSYMTTFELSYIDYLRQVGLVGISFFIVFILKPVKKLFINQRWLLIGYISYLVVAFTNPLLVTSTSFMLYLLVYSEYLLVDKEKIIQL